jgi:hypothetical protein
MNLWSKIQRTYTTDKTKDYYNIIKNGNYYYTIKYSVNDDMIFELYKNIMCTRRDIKKIKDIYNKLDTNRVKGWIMIHTLDIINNNL